MKAIQRNYEAAQAEAAQRIGYQVGYSEQALKTLALVNGGAIIGLFTFIGNNGSLPIDVSWLWWAFASFVAGLAFTMIGYLGAFMSQGKYYQAAQAEAWNELDRAASGLAWGRDHDAVTAIGFRWELAGVAAGMLALLAFVTGAGMALAGALPA